MAGLDLGAGWPCKGTHSALVISQGLRVEDELGFRPRFPVRGGGMCGGSGESCSSGGDAGPHEEAWEERSAWRGRCGERRR